MRCASSEGRERLYYKPKDMNSRIVFIYDKGGTKPTRLEWDAR